MNSKERVLTSARHREPDRVPLHIWYMPQVGAQLAQVYDVPVDQVEDVIGNDILMTHVGVNRGFDRDLVPDAEYVDEWGIRYKRVFYYNEVVGNPLAGVDDPGDYCMPDPRWPERWRALDRLVARYRDTHCIASDMSSNLFEIAFHLRGMERWLEDLVLRPAYAEALLERLLVFDLEVARLSVASGVDIVWLGSDVASQQGMIIPPDLWRRLFKERLAKLIEAIKRANTDVLVAYHSCGAIRPVIPDLIEIGVDVLNPIQPLARDMNPIELKRDYGDALTFHGGLDVQQLMPNGTPEQVREGVRRLMDALAPGGGFIFGPAHALQPDTPLANIEAMLDEVLAYGRYV